MRWVLGIAIATVVAGSAAAQEVKPVGFRIGARIPLGTPWAHLQERHVPLPCTEVNVLTWSQQDNERLQNTGLESVFRESLSKAGFRVAGDPSNLFEEDVKSSDLQVGALLTALDAKFCQAQTLKGFFANPDHYMIMGSASMDVEWQIYSTSQARIVARVPSSATFELKQPVDGGEQVILSGVFAANVDQLASSEAFRAAVRRGGLPPEAKAPLSPLKVAFRAPAAAVPMKDAARGVVSVIAGAGHGSGVLISSDGYILTNHHVAGEAGEVRVRWPDGTDTVGQVVRADRRRDVALIKTTPKAQPLAIRHTPANLGEAVFAIGTPLDRELAGTLTRGVVSTVSRTFEGQPYIQSDVAVTLGNSGGPLLDERGAVIGLTVLGLYPDQTQSLNLFIPIEEALKALALQPAG